MAPIGIRIVMSLKAIQESKDTLGHRNEQLIRQAGSLVASGSTPTKTMPFMVEDTFPPANFSFSSANSSQIPAGRPSASHDDATWILTSAFIIFTMQSGFGLLESGSVSSKNEVNIMVKNAVDVIFGGLSYWMFGFGLSFGEGSYSNPFCGWGQFFVSNTEINFGWIYSKFFFQASFATTATTIVSGAMAERTKLEAYILFSFVNTYIFCIPAHWLWANNGWLARMGVIDIAGAGPVHLVGGLTGLVATMMLKPRHNRYKIKGSPPMGSPSNAILGMFMLWWGWLGFNCGSTFGISGLKWKLAARSAVATICSSIAGGLVGLFVSYVTKRKQYDVPHLINGVLSSLVSITGMCALAQPWEAFIIGIIGAFMCLMSIRLLDWLEIDDPVGCVGVHAVGGIWSMITGGLFSQEDIISQHVVNSYTTHYGLFKGGGIHLLGIQVLATVSIIGWTLFTSYLCLKIIDLVIGLRVSLEHEILGADLVEHGVGNGECSYDKPTDRVTWLKTTTRTLHSCDECEMVKQVIRQTADPRGDLLNTEGFRFGDSFTKESYSTYVSRNDTQEISESLDRCRRYGSRRSAEGHTLGKRVTGTKWSSIRFQVRKKLRVLPKPSQATSAVTNQKQIDRSTFMISPLDNEGNMNSVLPL